MPSDQPFFSIVIPSYERPDRLRSCLQAIARLDYPRDRFEVVVVDDGSRESPRHIVESLRDRLTVHLVRQAHAGPATARNTGAATARGAFVAFTDDDCAPAADWLQGLATRFASSPHAMLGGRTINALPAQVCSSASQLLIDFLYVWYNAEPDRARFFTSSNMAVPVEDFRQIGGFDVRFPLAAAEDRDLCERWFREGRPMIYVAEACVHHAHSLTLRGFWRQHWNYGRGAYSFQQARARRSESRMRFEPFSFYFRLLSFPMSRGHGWRALPLASLLWISQVANALGFFSEAAMQSLRKGARR
jgi:GT2 family glycosyltransferase